MRRKLLISAVLFGIGTALYLSVSSGPLRVRSVTVPVQLIFLAGACCAVWAPAIPRRFRLQVLVGVVAVASAIATWIDSRVVLAFFPLQPSYFVTRFFAFLVEALLFLGAVALIDRVLSSREARGS
jgi:hypothetical protein